MANLLKINRITDVVHDVMGLVSSGLLLAVGIKTHRDGGSVGWPIAGAALLVVNTLWVVRRRLAQRRNAAPLQ
ncbi:hypothetical protein [Streptomyces sp. RB17]|uniref:hypothetical protein n=1 Tax=Streptomyces sp. RB17 TaxID=2585197 RepID=UPI0012957D6E|nr:hypothetical protein [Streptomyces sp. RB17]